MAGLPLLFEYFVACKQGSEKISRFAKENKCKGKTKRKGGLGLGGQVCGRVALALATCSVGHSRGSVGKWIFKCLTDRHIQHSFNVPHFLSTPTHTSALSLPPFFYASFIFFFF